MKSTFLELFLLEMSPCLDPHQCVLVPPAFCVSVPITPLLWGHLERLISHFLLEKHTWNAEINAKAAATSFICTVRASCFLLLLCLWEYEASPVF